MLSLCSVRMVQDAPECHWESCAGLQSASHPTERTHPPPLPPPLDIGASFLARQRVAPEGCQGSASAQLKVSGKAAQRARGSWAQPAPAPVPPPPPAPRRQRPRAPPAQRAARPAAHQSPWHLPVALRWATPPARPAPPAACAPLPAQPCNMVRGKGVVERDSRALVRADRQPRRTHLRCWRRSLHCSRSMLGLMSMNSSTPAGEFGPMACMASTAHAAGILTRRDRPPRPCPRSPPIAVSGSIS